MDAFNEMNLKRILGLLNVLLLIKILKDCLRIIEFKYGTVLLLVLAGIVLYLLFEKVINDRRKKFIVISLGLIISAYFLLRDSGALLNKVIYVYYNNYTVIINSVFAEEDIAFGEFLCTFIIVIPLLTCFFMGIAKKFPALPTIINTIICFVSWYLVFYTLVVKNIFFLSADIVFTLGIVKYNKSLREWRGEEIKNNVRFIQIISLLLIITLAIPSVICILPQEFSGKNVKGIVTVFKNSFINNKSKKDGIAVASENSYSMKESGYTDSSEYLGGPIDINGRTVFTVKSDMPYYLRGKIKDTYLGNRWTNSDNEIVKITNVDTIANGGMKYLKDTEGFYGKVSRKTIEITPEKNLNSTSFFTPNGALNIESSYDDIYVDSVPLFLTDKNVFQNYKVNITSYGSFDMYLQGIEHREYMNIAQKDKLILPMREYGEDDAHYYQRVEKDIDTTDSEKLQQYNDFKWHYINYMQVPNTVRKEVYNLVESIVNEGAKEYNKGVEDLTADEKALAIMKYMRKNYTYTLEVENGDYDDFVSEFLLDKKSGYCTYFASATTIMCRIAGVPARYVEGFNMNNEQGIYNTYRITNRDAHAWSEVLVNYNCDQWAVADSVPVEEEQERINDNNEDDQSDSTDTSTLNVQHKNVNAINPEDDIEIDDENQGNKRVYGIALLIVGTIAGVMVLLVALYRYTVLKVIKSSSVVPLYDYYLLRLRTISIYKDESSCDIEFAEKIKDSVLREKLLELINMCYKEYYGGETIEKIDKKEYINFIESYLKKINGNKRYIFKKYIRLS